MFDRFPDLPWERGEKARPNTRLFYQIVIGAIRMEEATAKLLEIYTDEEVERVSAVGSAPIAILTVDNKGIPVEPIAIAISSFAWGLPLALRRQLSVLGDWPAVEPKLVEEADKLARRGTDDEAPLPVDQATINHLFQHIARTLKLPSDCLIPPEFALRVFQWWKADDPPDPPPMGSFFLNDLAKAQGLVRTDSVPKVLKRYMGITVPTEITDIRCDDVVLAEAIAPSRVPTGCWPSGYPLVLLQQTAVNLALRSDASCTLLPVNGPPGTGKSTLLRDVVAGLLVDRALAMAAFDDPNDAFAASGQRFRSGNAFTHHYQMDSTLKGFEVVVASSNNKAVENVSAELPALRAIDPTRTDLRYFKSISDNLAKGPSKADYDADEQTDLFERATESLETWGLVAAILGNAKNRYAFRQTAWSDNDCGLRPYLLEASGNPQTIEVKDKNSGRITEKRKPRVVTAEKPPLTPEAALRRWRSARKKFLQANQKVRDRLALLERGRRALAPGDLFAKRQMANETLSHLQAELLRLGQQRESLDTAAEQVSAQRSLAERAILSHQQTGPGLLGRLLSPSSFADWDQKRSQLARNREETVGRANEIEKSLSVLRYAEAEYQRKLSDAQRAAIVVDAAIHAASGDVDNAVAMSRERFVDAAFLARPSGELQRDTPWIDTETQHAREEAFIAAIDLHRAFVDAAAKQIRNNLELLFRAFFGRSAWSDKMRPLMPDLWATLFCVIPVVSTTFASVERMFGYLDPEALGWLLVDEAGQAVPQAAVGAVMRFKHAIVVGDPLQLPPVTTLPSELAQKIAAEFEVDEERFFAPAASVQTLADGASLIGTNIVSGGEPIRVGVPLVVHRRCAEPMFSLSNWLAYDGMMVQGRGEKPSKIRDVLGRSAWIDVRPDRCEDKWSVAEGRAVVDLLRRLDRAQIDELDLYIISPFRIVAQRLRELLLAEKVLSRWTNEPYRWVRERVGTIYTVQGREADTIVMVLGAAQPERRGARDWAGSGVNQLNVAVTRAKENLYVIGNRFEWASAGNFALLEQTLP